MPKYIIIKVENHQLSPRYKKGTILAFNTTPLDNYDKKDVLISIDGQKVVVKFNQIDDKILLLPRNPRRKGFYLKNESVSDILGWLEEVNTSLVKTTGKKNDL